MKNKKLQRDIDDNLMTVFAFEHGTATLFSCQYMLGQITKKNAIINSVVVNALFYAKSGMEKIFSKGET